MKVEQIMSASPLSCGPDTTLPDVAMLMWEGDCGFMPVIDRSNHVVGVVTDRDICLATGTRKRPPSQICVRDLMDGDVACCHPTDDVRDALALMSKRGVRRLPVVSRDGVLLGVLSIDDVVTESGTRGSDDVSARQLLDTLKAVCVHHQLPALTGGH